MELSIATILIALLGVFFIAFMKGAFGGGFAIIGIPLLSIVMDPLTAGALLAPLFVAMDVFALRYWKPSTWSKPDLAVLVPSLAMGIGLLYHVDAKTFRVGFGVFLAAYAAYMFFRPAVAYLRLAGNPFLGGVTAMPGAVTTIWCDLHGMAKEEQRGLVQPFIAAMQIATLALMLSRHSLPSNVVTELAFTLPALAAGTALGIALFGKANDVVFRRVMFAVLFVAGLGLAA